VSFLSNISTLIEVRSYLTYSDCNNLYDKKSLLNQIKEPYQTAFNGLVVSNVVFKYPNSSKEFKYNLRVRENSIVGIQGESGSGKSTLLNLIIGVFPYKRGSICLKEICQNSVFDDNWLDTISLVSQDVTLFEGTILHNIVLENPVNTKLLNEAIDIANLKDLINQKTLDYRISSSTTGANKGLSGGEKQRIGIARAIYKDSRIVVLDEATSALDKKSAVKIVNKLKILSKSKIIIMSSHDPEILKNVDNVIHISNITR
jgi:ABC-type multidrug transport system fused ATPase/permease subunit